MVNSLFFPALSTISPPVGGAEKWRMCTKTSNTYDSNLTIEMIFRYYDNPSEFDITGKNMTLFHMGSDSTTSGVDIILRKGANPTDPIQLGYRVSNGTVWTDVASSFVSLNSIGDVSTDAFYFMLSYNYAGSNNIINFYVVTFNATVKTTYDFSYINDPALNIEPIGNQWGFGSLPQALPDVNGYNNDEGYDGYIAQNIELNYLRTWDTDVPATSSSAGVYAMFNTVDSTHSLYLLNKSDTYVPAGVTNLNFQLYVPPSSTNLTQLANNAVNPAQVVTTGVSSTSFPTLNPPGSYNFAINDITGFIVITASDIPCMLKGTKILTPTGYKLIETLNINDEVLTYDNRVVKITSILNRQVKPSEENYPHIIRKGKYGAIEDLYLSRGHAVLIDNIFYHPYKLNLDICRENKIFHYYCLKLENYLADSLVANGVSVEPWSGWTPENPVIDVPIHYITQLGDRIHKINNPLMKII